MGSAPDWEAGLQTPKIQPFKITHKQILPFYIAVQPPSTKIDVPVIILEESEAKKATAVATSLNSANFLLKRYQKVLFLVH